MKDYRWLFLPWLLSRCPPLRHSPAEKNKNNKRQHKETRSSEGLCFSSPCSLHGPLAQADYSMWLMSQILMTLSVPVVKR